MKVEISVSEIVEVFKEIQEQPGESAIRKRMKAMLEHGVYKIEVVPNPEILEYEAWATIGITINNQYAHNVIDSIIKYPAVYLASVSLGRFNIVMACRFANTELLNQFVRVELPSIQGISSTETFLHNKPLKYHNVSWTQRRRQLGANESHLGKKDR